MITRKRLQSALISYLYNNEMAKSHKEKAKVARRKLTTLMQSRMESTRQVRFKDKYGILVTLDTKSGRILIRQKTLDEG